MQWDSTSYSGFTTKKDGAWMKTHDLYKEINVATQLNDPKSVLNFWKNMIQMRKKYMDLFIHGAWQGYEMENEETFVFGKSFGKDRAIVALNFTDKPQVFKRPDVGGKLDLLVSNVEGVDGTEEKLEGYEGRIYLVG
jgi:alpha-glucosidase